LSRVGCKSRPSLNGKGSKGPVPWQAAAYITRGTFLLAIFGRHWGVSLTGGPELARGHRQQSHLRQGRGNRQMWRAGWGWAMNPRQVRGWRGRKKVCSMPFGSFPTPPPSTRTHNIAASFLSASHHPSDYLRNWPRSSSCQPNQHSFSLLTLVSLAACLATSL
jgi:hypothetical protein